MANREWLTREMESIRSSSDNQKKDWIEIPEGSTIYRFKNLDQEAEKKQTQYGTRRIWILSNGEKIGATKVLHEKLVKFFSEHGDLSACTIVRIGQGRDTRWQVI